MREVRGRGVGAGRGQHRPLCRSPWGLEAFSVPHTVTTSPGTTLQGAGRPVQRLARQGAAGPPGWGSQAWILGRWGFGVLGMPDGILGQKVGQGV